MHLLPFNSTYPALNINHVTITHFAAFPTLSAMKSNLGGNEVMLIRIHVHSLFMSRFNWHKNTKVNKVIDYKNASAPHFKIRILVLQVVNYNLTCNLIKT